MHSKVKTIMITLLLSEQSGSAGDFIPLVLIFVLIVLLVYLLIKKKLSKKKEIDREETFSESSEEGEADETEYRQSAGEMERYSAEDLYDYGDDETVYRETENDGSEYIREDDDTVYRDGEETDSTVIIPEDNIHTVVLSDTRYPERNWRGILRYSLVIGYSEEADICISYDRSVSRKQCELICERDKFYIINHSRSNITKLNGKRIEGKMPVRNGDLITMGRVEVRLEVY